jgi:hypothetical protein
MARPSMENNSTRNRCVRPLLAEIRAAAYIRLRFNSKSVYKVLAFLIVVDTVDQPIDDQFLPLEQSG